MRPFFRFSVDTAEMDGQYEALLKAQEDGAEVYYVAPRFADWSHYVRLFETETVLENSVMVTPREIRDALVAKGSADGQHRIVYDSASFGAGPRIRGFEVITSASSWAGEAHEPAPANPRHREPHVGSPRLLAP